LGGSGIPEGTVLEITITKPGQEPVSTNMKVLASDLALAEELKLLEAQTADADCHYQAARTDYERIRSDVEKAEVLIREKNEQLKATEKSAKEKRSSYQQMMEPFGLTEAELPALLEEQKTLELLEKQKEDDDAQIKSAQQLVTQLRAECENKTPYNLSKLQAVKEQNEQDLARLDAEYRALLSRSDHNARQLERIKKNAAAIKTIRCEYHEVHNLYQIASGKGPSRVSLERKILGYYFDQVLDAANLHLRTLTVGRYELRRVLTREKGNAGAGLDLEIYDAYCGRCRPVQALSGGETFKASLCLALGLSNVLSSYAGGIEIDTLFIDEGFGSLDAVSLNTAFECLDTLRQSGRNVGIISHVEELKEKIPVQAVIHAGKNGSTLTVTA